MAWKIRLEYLLISTGDGTPSGATDVVFSAQTLTGSGATVITSAAAPSFLGRTRGQARITVLSGAALVAPNDTTPTETDSLRVAVGDAAQIIDISTGQTISFREAADAPDGVTTTEPTAANDPIFDNARGTKTSLTVSAVLITPPAGCKWVRITCDVDILINTADATVVDNGTSTRIVANIPEIVPVTAGVSVRGLSTSGTATVRCTPLKARA